MPDWAIAGIIAIVVIFGATKLPEIARNLGRSSNEFKKGLKEGSADLEPQPAPPQPAVPQPAPAPRAETPPASQEPKPSE
jgi:sec-independent protein translocase protein TatA